MGSGLRGAAGAGPDWRVVDGVATAWFAATSLSEGAALAGRVGMLTGDAVVDLRSAGVRVRLVSDEHAQAVSAAARDLGLTADPAALQQLGVVVESVDPSAITRFWQSALEYAPGPDGGLQDPLQRDPAFRVRRSAEPRPLRNRIHVDVVRPAEAVEQAALGEAYGPFGVCHADADGNEVDLVPGGALDESPATSDWHAVFGAMACYRVTTAEQQRALSGAAAAMSDEAGFPLVIDVRPGLVVLDSGKDQWEADAHGLAVDFTRLAAALQAAARELGATADPTLPRFAQLVLDAADIDAVRAFWCAALQYAPDRRAGVTDLVDPRRLNPVLVLQDIDASDTERRRQRSRIHLELAVPPDQEAGRVAAAVDAGGRVLEVAGRRHRVADPEGNELVILAEA